MSGYHCSLIEQEEIEDRSAREVEVKGKMEERTGWRGQNDSQEGGVEKKSGRLVGAAETSKGLAEWRRFQQRNLSILGLLKRKEWRQRHRESSWQVHQSRLCRKEKGQSSQSRVPDRDVGETQGERKPHLGEREREIRARA